VIRSSLGYITAAMSFFRLSKIVRADWNALHY